MIRTIRSQPGIRQAWAWGALAAALLLCQAAEADTKVGVTAAVNPEATGTPPSSRERVLYVGVDMQADERIRTTENGRVQLLFLDGSALSIGPNSDVVIDKYVYDPDDADNPGELAFRATKGVFRLIGGKISKVKPVIMNTSSASIGVRGSGALINASEGQAKSTAVFMHGKDMFVECASGGCQGERTTVTRPGSAVDFGQGLLSSPYLAKADLIKAIQAGFEKSGGLGEIAPAAGPGGPAGGGTPDDALANTGIANANSGTTANSLVVPPLAPSTEPSKLDQTAQDAIADSTGGNAADAIPAGDGGGEAPPPPAPAPTGSFTEGRIARVPVGSNFDNQTSTFTPDPDNYGPIVNAIVTNPGNGPVANNAITLSTNEVLDLPYAVGSFAWSTMTGSTLINVGFGFVADDNTFFRYWGLEFPTQQTARTFEVFGGVPTSVFPTSGFATHQVLPLFGTTVGESTIGLALLPFLNSDLLNADPNVLLPLTINVGQQGVTVSPLYSAFSPTIPVNGQAQASNARPVTLQSTLALVGTGAGQTSLVMGQIGTYFKESASADVALVGSAVGSYRPAANGAPIRFITGTTSPLTGDGGTAIFGPDAEFIVAGPELMTRVGTTVPATFSRQPGLGFAQPLDDLNGSSYFYQATFQKVDPSTVGASDLGQTRTAQALGGYVAGIADVLHPADQQNPNATITPYFFRGAPAAGDALPVQITLDPSTNRLTSTFLIESQDGEATNSIDLRFGSLTGINQSSSAFIDDTRFAAADAPATTVQSTFNGVPVRAQLFMVTNAAVPVDPNSEFLSGITLCACQYMQWGWWTGELLHNDAQAETPGERDRFHLATWVAGSLPAIADIPTAGTATFSGHIVGNVVNNGASYLAAGNFNHGWDFATKSGNILAGSSFDGMTLTGGANSLNGRDFQGFVNAANGINGAYNGSFFKGAGDPTKSMGGQFSLSGGNYVAGGTFAAQKVTP